MVIRARNCEDTSHQPSSLLRRKAVWSGYNQTYVKNIVSGAIKALKLLSALTFDPGLFFWTKGLENHLNNKIQEAEREEAEIKRKYTF
jgi:hypothetical protein